MPPQTNHVMPLTAQPMPQTWYNQVVPGAAISNARPFYFAQPTITGAADNSTDTHSIISFMDGSAPLRLKTQRPRTIIEEFASHATGDASFDTTSSIAPSFAVWNAHDPHSCSAFHAKVHLEGKEGLVIDTGAVDNLAGDQTIRRLEMLAAQNGHGTAYSELPHRLPVDGVGAGSSECSHACKVPIMLSDSTLANYSSPMITDSSIPALLGTRSMTEHRVLVDLVHDQMIMLGAGGMQLTLSPGSRVLPLQRTPTGHLIIEASAWPNKDNPQSQASAGPALALPVL
jgi:hypothetical protein